MANLTNAGNINFSTANAWKVIDPTAFSTVIATQETGTTASASGYASGVAFTPGAITIDAIAFKLSSRNTGASGLVGVRLFNNTAGAAVAGTGFNIASGDLPNGITWVPIALPSPVTLLAATSYSVQIFTSSAGLVTPFRKSATASDWTFYLRTTTTATASAGDQFIIAGDYVSNGVNNSYTVAMDNTAATTFGAAVTGAVAMDINNKGTLAYPTAASTTYRLDLAGILVLNFGSTLTIGTSGAVMPSTSNASLTMVEASNVQFQINCRTGCTFTTFGAFKTGRAMLAADAAAAATSITTATTTGWVTGDDIVLASTTRTIAETELRTLAVDSSGTTVTVPALNFAHSGTGQTAGELMNLTRNVVIRGTSTTLQTSMILSGVGVFSFNNTQFQFMGSATVNLRGIDCQVTAGGSILFSGCSFRNFEATSSIGLNLATNGGSNSISDCVFYRCNTQFMAVATVSAGTFSFTNCWGMVNIASNNNGFSFANTVGSINGLVSVSVSGSGVIFTNLDAQNVTVANVKAHSNTLSGISFSNSNSTGSDNFIHTGISCWRNNAFGVVMATCSNITLDTGTIFGNTTAGISLAAVYDSRFIGLTLNAGTTLTQPIGISLVGSNGMITVANGSFGATTTHATADINVTTTRVNQYMTLRNCLLASTTEVGLQTNLNSDSYIGSARHDQTAGSHRMWRKFGTITSDSALFYVASPSQRITPNNATNKISTWNKTVAVPSGRSARISVAIRKSVIGDGTAYNGNQPRLILLRDSAVGVNANTVLATSTNAANGAFEILTATTSSINDNAGYRFAVDCDGTTGWVNVDYWIVDVV